MYYKLYIDSVFILQMASNLYLLSLAGQILKCTATHKRIWMGAAAGASMVCIAIIVPVGTVGIRILASAIPVSMCMLRATFRIRHGKKLLRASLLLASCGFFLGSIMIWIQNHLRTIMRGHAGLLIALVTGFLSYQILFKLIVMVRRRKENCLRTVEIYVPELQQKVRMQAFLDTGNHLTDPVSGKPVNLISEGMAKQVKSVFRPEKYHAIPFRSVGRERGVLSAYELPEMVIEGQEQTIRKEHVIVAICNTGISEESIYQMILHPRLLED